jgi:uncharacterized protein YdhG (YjbR/CyaY superfamily)
VAGRRPKTITEYIQAAPRQAHPHLRRLHAILKSVAPEAEETIKWGVPFFIEPRFLFSFSAFKTHCVFAPSPEALERFRNELKAHKTTKNYLQIRYDQPLPEELVRKIAGYRLKVVRERHDAAFW